MVGLTGVSGGDLGGLAFLDDQVYAVLSAPTASTLYTLDPETGLATLVADVGEPPGPGAAVNQPDERGRGGASQRQV